MAKANDEQSSTLITKTVLYAGEGGIPSFEHGSKVKLTTHKDILLNLNSLERHLRHK